MSFDFLTIEKHLGYAVVTIDRGDGINALVTEINARAYYCSGGFC